MLTPSWWYFCKYEQHHHEYLGVSYDRFHIFRWGLQSISETDVQPCYSRCRICSNSLQAIKYVPRNCMGLDITNLFLTQGIWKVAMFIEERDILKHSVLMIRASYEAALIHLGIGDRNLFKSDYNFFKVLLPPSWIKSLWEFTSINEIEVPGFGIDLKLLKKRYFVQWNDLKLWDIGRKSLFFLMDVGYS